MKTVKRMQIGRAIKKAEKRPYTDDWGRYQLFLALREYFIIYDVEKGLEWDDLDKYEMFDHYFNRDHHRFQLVELKQDFMGKWHGSHREYPVVVEDWDKPHRAYSTTHNSDSIGFTHPRSSMTDWVAYLDPIVEKIVFKVS